MKYIYLLKMGQYYKVGVGINVTSRLKGLQTSNPEKIEVVMTRLVEDAYKLEHKTHAYLQERWSGGGTEWFKLDPVEVIKLAIEICKIPEVDMTQQITVRTILAKQDEKQARIEEKLNKLLIKKPAMIKEIRLPERNSIEKIYADRTSMIDESLESKALEIFREAGKASTSILQRKLRIGYGRASRIIETLESKGHIPAGDGVHARKIEALV